MSKFYRASMLPLSLGALPFLLVRRRGRSRWWERYGAWGEPLGEVTWFHGSSVGEVTGLLPLIEEWRKNYPEDRILLTTTSVTGLDRAEGLVDFLRVLPFDHPLWIRRALRSSAPRVFIFGETEIWPNLLAELALRGVPAYLVNGRISDFSFKAYRRINALLADTFSKIRLIFASFEEYEKRFIACGALPGQLLVEGNAKYDRPPLTLSAEELLSHRNRFFPEDAKLLVLGSIRPGEEQFWFPQLLRAWQSDHSLAVVVAPRHREKFEYFDKQLKHYGISFVRWSKPDDEKAAVLLLDTFGELESFYACADLSFIGATLIEGFGGHNPLEAAAYGTCTVLGPHCENVIDVVRKMEECEGCLRVTSSDDIKNVLSMLLLDLQQVKQIGARGQGMWRELLGSSARIIGRIRDDFEGLGGGRW